jgi:LacI family transcriptional regulator
MVTMQDVADRAGVTKQTVSNVVSGRIRVRPATAARVRAAIDDLGYTPNLVARSLTTGTTKTIGLLIPTIADSFYSEVVEEVEDTLDRHGYHMMLCTTRLDGERAHRQLAGLSSRLVDALLIAGDQDLAAHLEVLSTARFPVALCAWETEPAAGFPVITIDYERAGYLAGRHLRELGHERVAVLASPNHAARVDGLRRAFAEDGLTVPGNLVIISPDPSAESGFVGANKAFGIAPELTAIFATTDVRAVGALEAARATGRAVPKDLSVIGHDDNPEVQVMRPALTTVSIPKREMARHATEALLRAIAHPGERTTDSLLLLRPSLLIRDSTGPAARR